MISFSHLDFVYFLIFALISFCFNLYTRRVYVYFSDDVGCWVMVVPFRSTLIRAINIERVVHLSILLSHRCTRGVGFVQCFSFLAASSIEMHLF